MVLTGLCETTDAAWSAVFRNDRGPCEMSLWSRLFGRRTPDARPVAAIATRPTPRPPEPVLHFGATGDRFVRIPSLDFFGLYCRSPDGAWLIAWRDGNDAGTHSGHRDTGPGRFYVFHGDELKAQGRAERPQDGKIANDGNFILNDWRFGSALNGTFCAYRSDGRLILKRDFAANLVNNGIADDGSMAVCQAANAPHSPDSSVLAIFDLRAGREIAAWVPDSGWADAYNFPLGDATVRLHYRDAASFAFSIDGDFIERNAWISDTARRGNIPVLHHLLREVDNAISAELTETILGGAQAAMVASGFDETQRPLALKVCGLCQEALGNRQCALDSYDAAIALDPKIGLKRRAAQLRRDLS